MRTSIDQVFGEIDSLPGCSQVAVSHSVFVPIGQRGRGHATRANDRRLHLMREELGYDYALCTVDESNTAQVRVMASNGWSELDRFRSTKTGHTVIIYGRPL